MIMSPQMQEIQIWAIDRLIFYARNPRKNDAVVDRMCSSMREFGFKIPVLARSNGEVVDGHVRLKAARKLGSWPTLGPWRPNLQGARVGREPSTERRCWIEP